MHSVPRHQMDLLPCTGVLAFDADGGFYLLHSTPNFPDDPAAGNGYEGKHPPQSQRPLTHEQGRCAVDLSMQLMTSLTHEQCISEALRQRAFPQHGARAAHLLAASTIQKSKLCSCSRPVAVIA